MAGRLLSTAKTAALEALVTLRGGPPRRLRTTDGRTNRRCASREDRVHIEAALEWICRAQDATADDGVSAMYSLLEGWVGSYPETTGYIIPTIFDAARRYGRTDLHDRAQRMAEWLLTCQHEDGSFPGGFIDKPGPPRVFNTGQVIFGLLSAARHTQNTTFMSAACRAGDWLCGIQDRDGAWRTHTFHGIPHSYNVRVAWALLELAACSGDQRYDNTARGAAAWTARQQNDNGWLRNNAFIADDSVCNLHTIAYATRGLLECAVRTDETEWLAASRKTADALLSKWRDTGWVSGAYDASWVPRSTWRCLPGEAQLAIVWLRLHQVDHHADYDTHAADLLELTKTAQFIDPHDASMFGGISGSLPINGGYERYCLVNWGAKFLIDALLLKGSIDDDLS